MRSLSESSVGYQTVCSAPPCFLYVNQCSCAPRQAQSQIAEWMEETK
jgi:hypothetical protein